MARVTWLRAVWLAFTDRWRLAAENNQLRHELREARWKLQVELLANAPPVQFPRLESYH